MLLFDLIECSNVLHRQLEEKGKLLEVRERQLETSTRESALNLEKIAALQRFVVLLLYPQTN